MSRCSHLPLCLLALSLVGARQELSKQAHRPLNLAHHECLPAHPHPRPELRMCPYPHPHLRTHMVVFRQRARSHLQLHVLVFRQRARSHLQQHVHLRPHQCLCHPHPCHPHLHLCHPRPRFWMRIQAVVPHLRLHLQQWRR